MTDEHSGYKPGMVEKYHKINGTLYIKQCVSKEPVSDKLALIFFIGHRKSILYEESFFLFHYRTNMDSILWTKLQGRQHKAWSLYDPNSRHIFVYTMTLKYDPHCHNYSTNTARTKDTDGLSRLAPSPTPCTDIPSKSIVFFAVI